ncbi:MAG: nucleotidyltransferase family protein [Anaerolineae bacterium]
MSRPIFHLLAALRTDATPQTFDDPNLAWNDIVVQAIIVGLAPMLHERLSTWQINLPPLALAKLQLTRQATAQRNLDIQRQVAEILAATAARAIPTIVLKGAYLSAAVYPAPDLRGMSDIDLLFQPADLPQAAAALASLGYLGKHKAADEGPGITKHTSTYKRPAPAADTPNPYLSTSGDRHVDPHGSLEECWFGLCTDITPGIWPRAMAHTVNGQPAQALSANDLYLHLAVHLIYHLLMGKPSLVQLVDLLVVSQRLAAQLDWDWLLQRAQQTHAAPFLAAANHLAQTVLAAPVPADIQTRLLAGLPAHLRRTIGSLDADSVMQLSQRPPLTTMRQRVARGISERRATARWATSSAGRWAVWRSALAVTRTDTARLLARRLGLIR